jgi:hypothetical protein
LSNNSKADIDLVVKSIRNKSNTIDADIVMHKNNYMSADIFNDDKNDIYSKLVTDVNQYKSKRMYKKDDNFTNYEDKSLIDIKNVKKTDEFLDMNNSINVPN